MSSVQAVAARLPILLLLLLVGAPAAGCERERHDGLTPDERAVRKVVTLSFTASEIGRSCREWLSDGFIKRTFKTRPRCVRVQEDDEDEDEPADAVDFSRVVVDGDRATTKIKVRGGDTDGAAGVLRLVREDGHWRIDDLSAPFLRSLMERGLRTDEGDEELPASAEECLRRFNGTLSNAELRKLAYGLIGHMKEATRRTFETLADCEGDGGRSALRETFELAVTKWLEERGADEQVIGCIARALRDDISDEELVELGASEDDRAIVSEVAKAARACKLHSESLEPS